MKSFFLSLALFLPVVGKAQAVGPDSNHWGWGMTPTQVQSAWNKIRPLYPEGAPTKGQHGEKVITYNLQPGKGKLLYKYFFTSKGLVLMQAVCGPEEVDVMKHLYQNNPLIHTTKTGAWENSTGFILFTGYPEGGGVFTLMPPS